MRVWSLVLFTGAFLSIGWLFDASRQTAQAINCAHVCNTHRVEYQCAYTNPDGTLIQPNLYAAQQYALPQCHVNNATSEITFISRKGNKPFSNLSQWDTSTQQKGTCTDVQTGGNQISFLLACSQACPCPCYDLTPPDKNGSQYPCASVEGVFSNGTTTGTTFVVDLYACR